MSDKQKDPAIETVSVSPSLAAEWLATNDRNRNVRQAAVDAYARDMQNGRWRTTGETIKFDAKNRLIDGQHRLRAVIVADVTVDLMVIHGLDPEAQQVMDSGLKRSSADMLTMGGAKNSMIVSSAARLCLKEPDVGFTDVALHNPTNSEVLQFVADHPEVHRAAEIAASYSSHIEIQPSVLAVAWMRLAEIDTFAAGEFFSSIANMATSGAGDPRATLVKRLASARRNREKLTQAVVLSLVLRAWNAWRTGQPLHKLQVESAHGVVRIPKHLS